MSRTDFDDFQRRRMRVLDRKIAFFTVQAMHVTRRLEHAVVRAQRAADGGLSSMLWHNDLIALTGLRCVYEGLVEETCRKIWAIQNPGEAFVAEEMVLVWVNTDA